MSLLTPDFGLVFWMLLCFLIVLVILGKFGWPVIIGMINERGDYIEKSLEAANEANEKLKNIKAEADQILADAKSDRLEIVSEAKKLRDQIIAEAKNEAEKEAAKIKEATAREIQQEKENAIKEIVSFATIDRQRKILHEFTIKPYGLCYLGTVINMALDKLEKRKE